MSHPDHHPFRKLDTDFTVESPHGVRLRGVARLVFSILGLCAVGVLVWLFAGDQPRVRPKPLAMAVAAIPGCYALIAIAEIITGISYRQLKRRWQNLLGWQRVVSGALILLVATVVIIPVFVLLVLPLVRPF